MLGFSLYCSAASVVTMMGYIQVHEVIRGEHRCAVASLWLVPVCNSAMLLGTDMPLTNKNSKKIYNLHYNLPKYA